MVTAITPDLSAQTMFELPKKMFPLPTHRESVDRAICAENLKAVASKTTDPEVLMGLAFLARTGDPVRQELGELAVKARPESAPVVAVLAMVLRFAVRRGGGPVRHPDLAVRLLFVRSALEEAARQLSFNGNPSDLRAWLRTGFRDPQPPELLGRAPPPVALHEQRAAKAGRPLADASDEELWAALQVAQAADFVASVARENVKLQYDAYHMQRMEGNLVATLREYIGEIAHVQIADSPGRGQPGTGEIRFSYVLAELEALGYDGWVGLEYVPAGGTTEESLAWLPVAARSGDVPVAELALDGAGRTTNRQEGSRT